MESRDLFSLLVLYLHCYLRAQGRVSLSAASFSDSLSAISLAADARPHLFVVSHGWVARKGH